MVFVGVSDTWEGKGGGGGAKPFPRGLVGVEEKMRGSERRKMGREFAGGGHRPTIRDPSLEEVFKSVHRKIGQM